MPRGWPEARHPPRDGALGAGVGSAVGFLMAPVAYEVVRSRYVGLDDAFDPGLVNTLFAQLLAEAEAVVKAAAPPAPSCW